MMVSPDGYGRLTRLMVDAADRLCQDHLVVEHEGGYSAELVPFCGRAIMDELSGIRTEVRDTILQQFPAHMGQQELQPHQEQLIEQAARASFL